MKSERKTWLSLWCFASLLSVTLSLALPTASSGHLEDQSPICSRKPTLPFEVGGPGWGWRPAVFEKTASLMAGGITVQRDENIKTLISRRMDRQLQSEEMERWQSLPPDKQLEMRRRMERYKELSPEDRELFRKRYEQWQGLSPEERQRMREELKGWENLSPQEQERIRQKFRRP
jgi:hypothetical protein